MSQNSHQVQINSNVNINNDVYVTLKIEIFDTRHPYEVTDILAHDGKVYTVTKVGWPIRLRNETIRHQIVEIVLPR